MTRRVFILGGAGLVFTHVILGDLGVARSDSAVDRLSLPESIEFNGESYRLSWSFQRMVLIEAIVRGVDINDAVAAKVSMLNKRKSTDPTVNFAVVKNPKNNEIILDFILNAEDPKGDDIVEWNAYRYAALKGKGGASGVLLFGISRRGYGDDATDFLRRLKLARPAEVNALAAYPLPVVRLR